MANIKAIINKVLEANGKKKIDNVSRFFKDMSEQPRTIKNEFLEDLNAVLSKQHTINKLRGDIPIKTNWFKEKSMIGELEQIRQALNAKRGMYSELLDVNKHYKVKSVDQYFGTIYKDLYELSISPNIIKNAFISQQSFENYISSYLNAIDRAYELTWSERIISMLRGVPIVYKTDFNQDGVSLGKELDLLLSSLEQISPLFNVAGLPTYLKRENRLFVVSRRYKTKIKWEALANLFGASYIDEILENMVVYDFGDNGKTLAAIVDKNDYYMFESRLEENTSQEWARTMIKDNFLHDWRKGTRIDFSVGVRIVDSNLFTKNDGDTLDWKEPNGSLNGLSYFIHTENGDEIVKDEPVVIVIDSSKILDIQIPRFYEVDLETVIRVVPKVKDAVSSADLAALKTWLINNNVDLTPENFNVVSATATSFTVEAVEGLSNVDSNHNQLVVKAELTAPAAKQEVNYEQEIKDLKEQLKQLLAAKQEVSYEQEIKDLKEQLKQLLAVNQKKS